jgi:hypothetical protein
MSRAVCQKPEPSVSNSVLVQRNLGACAVAAGKFRFHVPVFSAEDGGSGMTGFRAAGLDILYRN